MFSVGELQNLIWTSICSESVPRVTRRSKQKSVAKAWENKNWQHFGGRNPQTHMLLEKVSLFKMKIIWLSNILQRRIVPIRKSTKHKCIHVYICIHTFSFKLWKAQWQFQNRFSFFCRHTSPSHAAADKHSSSAALLTWCYPSRWCEKASPVRPRSACRQRRRPGTHPETASRHLQADTETNKRNKMWTFFQGKKKH